MCIKCISFLFDRLAYSEKHLCSNCASNNVVLFCTYIVYKKEKNNKKCIMCTVQNVNYI